MAAQLRPYHRLGTATGHTPMQRATRQWANSLISDCSIVRVEQLDATGERPTVNTRGCAFLLVVADAPRLHSVAAVFIAGLPKEKCHATTSPWPDRHPAHRRIHLHRFRSVELLSRDHAGRLGAA